MQVHGAGRLAEAQALYGAIIARAPGHAGALHLLGVCHFQQGRFAEGVPLVERALSLKPDYVEAHNNLANALRALGRQDDAVIHYDRALALQPNYPAAHYNRGNALMALRRPIEALEAYDRALALEPGNPQISNNRGLALQELQRPEEALASFERALALAPTLAEAHVNRANLLRDLHRFEPAIASYSQALALKPDYAEAAFNRGILHLLRGDFAAGWPDYERRWQFARFAQRADNGLPPALIARLVLCPERETFKGRRCVVLGEQGIGDQVMFAGLLRDLERDAAGVTCLCNDRLVKLLALSFPTIEFLPLRMAASASFAESDVVVAIGSLAHAYRRSAVAFSREPYLTASDAAVEKWRRRLGEDPRPKIGVSWRGGTADTRSAARSLALDQLLPLFANAGLRFVSLQYGDVADEVRDFAAAHGVALESFPQGDIEDFDDLAGVIANLDSVVSVQTALIHLCGALGKECLTLLPRQPEWRYGVTEETMPWYGSVRLLRQGPEEKWGAVAARAASLAAR